MIHYLIEQKGRCKMKWLDGFRIELMAFGLITAIVLNSFNPANGAMITVGPGAGYDFHTIQAGIDARFS